MRSIAKTIGLALVLIVGGVLLAAGLCSVYWGSFRSEPTTKDVTADKSYWGGYEPGAAYVTKQDLFLLGDPGDPAGLYPPETLTGVSLRSTTGESLRTPSLAAYRADPAKYPFLRGITPAGTRLRVKRISVFENLNFTSRTFLCELLDGPLRACSVTLDGISQSYHPNPAYLEETPR